MAMHHRVALQAKTHNALWISYPELGAPSRKARPSYPVILGQSPSPLGMRHAAVQLSDIPLLVE